MDVLDFASSPGSTDDEMLGALLALKNPSYWQNMMMPGYGAFNTFLPECLPDVDDSFSWSEPRMSGEPTYAQIFPPLFGGFEGMQAAPPLQMA